jgi:UDP-glucose:glycoprotein glucosyltransferase
LETLTYLSQNFPKYATSIARRVHVNQSLAAEVSENGLKAQAGINMFWVNGAQIDEKDINPLR